MEIISLVYLVAFVIVGLVVLIVKLTSCDGRGHKRIPLGGKSRYCPVCVQYERYEMVDCGRDKAWLLFEAPPANEILEGIRKFIAQGVKINWSIGGESYTFCPAGFKETASGRMLEESELLSIIGRKATKVTIERGHRKVFSFDAETNGLWGKTFAIGALVYDEAGTEIARFVGRLPDTEATDRWVIENVLPKIGDIPITHQTYDELLSSFAEFYKANKKGCDVVVHMGVPVESKLLVDMHSHGLIGDWDGPFPLYDVSGNLQAAGEDPTSVDKYLTQQGLFAGKFEGGSHNPLYDSAVAAVVYRDLMSRVKISDWRI